MSNNNSKENLKATEASNPLECLVSQICQTCLFREISICKKTRKEIDLFETCDEWEVVKNIYTGEPFGGGLIFTVPIIAIPEKSLILCTKRDLFKMCIATGLSGVDNIKNNKKKMAQRLSHQINEIGIALHVSLYG